MDHTSIASGMAIDGRRFAPMDADRTITNAIDFLDRCFVEFLLQIANEAESEDAMRETVEMFTAFYHLRMSLSIMRTTWKDQAAIRQEMCCEE